jgi:hypothetical protein
MSFIVDMNDVYHNLQNIKSVYITEEVSFDSESKFIVEILIENPKKHIDCNESENVGEPLFMSYNQDEAKLWLKNFMLPYLNKNL